MHEEKDYALGSSVMVRRFWDERVPGKRGDCFGLLVQQSRQGSIPEPTGSLLKKSPPRLWEIVHFVVSQEICSGWREGSLQVFIVNS
jgi:hypothetical protein